MSQNAESRMIKASLKKLNSARDALSSRQYRTIRGQIIAGDIHGAEKGLCRMLPANYILKEDGLYEVHC